MRGKLLIAISDIRAFNLNTKIVATYIKLFGNVKSSTGNESFRNVISICYKH